MNNKGSTYRHRTAIVNSILKAIASESVDQLKGILTTHLMYTAYVNHNQLSRYLDEMEKSDLVKIEIKKDSKILQKYKEHTFVTITSKGRDFLKLYNTLEQITDVI
jgi:predicted transcriptional regulator